MKPRIQTVLASAIGLVAFSLLSLAPTGLAAAATQSGFLMQKTDGTPEVWQMDSTGHALGFDFDLAGPVGNGWQIVGVGDFDGDGNPDILWQNADGTPGIWFLNGTRVVQMVGLSNPGSNWRIVGVGDFNGDGKADIVWQATDGTPGIWLMRGSTPIAEAGLGGPSSWQIVGVGDFNADGKSDLLWQTTDGSGAGVWLMNGTTPTAEAGLASPGAGWKAVGTGDFNGDGTSDVVWQYTDGSAMIWFMNGTSNTGQVSIISSTSWKIVAAADFNGDGKSDILWQNPDGTPGIWLMNGTTPIWEGPLKNPGTSWKIITAGAFGAPAPIPVQANDGHVQITTVGGLQTVFNHTTDACDPANDQPDSSGYAFLAADGTVNLTGNTWPANYRMIGPSLDSLQRSCTPTYQSVQDTYFPDSEYREWLGPMHTIDGTTVYGLVHNEWYPTCTNDPVNFNLLFSMNVVVSNNGGATYSHPPNYKIAVPPPWDGSTCPVFYGYGYAQMISSGGYYYTFFQVFPAPDGAGSRTCLMRTADLSNGSSWQTLTGGNWQPLPAPGSPTFPQCDNLSSLQGNPNGLVYSTYLNAYVVLTFGIQAGEGYTTSQDLINWAPSQTIFASTVNGLSFLYGSLIDPNSNRNFETVGQQPYIYLVYVKPNGDRDIVRQQIMFTILN